MGAITLDGILRAEHDMIEETLVNTGTDDKDIRDAFQYIFGINDFAGMLIRELNGKQE